MGTRQPTRRNTFILLSAALTCGTSPPLIAQTLPSWFGLEPGPHEVGYRVLYELDRSRVRRTAPDSSPPRETARPIRISVWSPADVPSSTPTVTLAEFVRDSAPKRILHSAQPSVGTAVCQDILRRLARLVRHPPDATVGCLRTPPNGPASLSRPRCLQGKRHEQASASVTCQWGTRRRDQPVQTQHPGPPQFDQGLYCLADAYLSNGNSLMVIRTYEQSLESLPLDTTMSQSARDRIHQIAQPRLRILRHTTPEDAGASRFPA